MGAMNGFLDVTVKHKGDKIFLIETSGPDDDTSPELKNLAQMGEFSDFCIKFRKNFNYNAIPLARPKDTWTGKTQVVTPNCAFCNVRSAMDLGSSPVQLLHDPERVRQNGEAVKSEEHVAQVFYFTALWVVAAAGGPLRPRLALRPFASES